MKMLILGAMVFVFVFSTPFLCAEQIGDSPPKGKEQLTRQPNEQGQGIQSRAGIPWRENVVRQRYIANRAADRRNALKRSARSGKQELSEAASVDSYNNMIIKNNSRIRQQELERTTRGAAQPQ